MITSRSFPVLLAGLALALPAAAGSPNPPPDELAPEVHVSQPVSCADQAVSETAAVESRPSQEFGIVTAPFRSPDVSTTADLATPLRAEVDGLVAASPFRMMPLVAGFGSDDGFGPGPRLSVRPLGGSFGSLSDPFSRPGFGGSFDPFRR